MRKDNFAATVIINMPYSDANRLELLPRYMLVTALYIRNMLIVPSIMSLIYRSKRRIYSYIFLNGELDAQAPEDRCKDSGTRPKRNTQPSPRSDRRSALSEQPFLRRTGSFTNPLRDAASASHRRALDCGGDARFRRFSPDVLSRTDRVHRAGSRRLVTTPTRAERPPQAFRRSSPTHSRVEDGGPNSHNHAMRAGDSTALRYQRASSQSRTRPAEQKKTARSAVTHLIPARAGEDYETLREQLFGIERPGASAPRFSLLVRCGLAAWALGRHDLATLAPHVPLASIRTPVENATAASLLVNLIANLILSPRQEAPPCRT